jgi:6-phosphofructokinase
LSIDVSDLEASSAAHIMALEPALVRTIDRAGGTMLHTSRVDPRCLKPDERAAYPALADARANDDGGFDATPHILKVLDALGIDVMVTMGGDGTLRYSAHLSRLGVPVVTIPKTMDNDVFGTDYCIGFSTAVSRSVEAITALRTTVSSHERIGVIELFGRRSGETALMAGYLSQVDRVVISEVPVAPDRLADLLAEDRARNAQSYAMMVVSEGAHLAGEAGAKDIAMSASTRASVGIGRRLSDHIRARTGQGTVLQELAYLMRSGAPDALDKMVGMAFGTLAIQLIEAGRDGVMTAVVDGNYEAVDAQLVAQGCKMVDVKALYDPHAYRPKIAAILHKPMFLY